jgi:hypothetical protein
MTTLQEAHSGTKSYIAAPAHRWPVAMNFDHIRNEQGVVALVLPRGQVAVWTGHEWRRVGLGDWAKVYLEPLNHRLSPFSVVQFSQLTEATGNGMQLRYQVTQGLVEQLLRDPWHPSLARIVTLVWDS